MKAEALKVGANWFVVDATNVVLGRLATKVARVLIGKDKPSFYAVSSIPATTSWSSMPTRLR